MAKQKTPKQKKQDQPNMGFPQTLPYHDDTEDEGKQASPDDSAKTIAELQKQVAELSGKLSAPRSDRYVPLARDPQPPRVQTEISTDGLPDPVENPTEYVKQLNERIGQTFEGRKQMEQYQKTAQQTQQERLNALWEEFTEHYGNYAEDFERVEFAAGKVAQRAKAKGIDVNQYMFGHSDRFMEDVVKYMDKTFGKPGEGDDDDGKALETSGADDDDDDSRTAGIFGGQESGGKPSGGQSEPSSGGSLLGDLRKIQMEQGFYR